MKTCFLLLVQASPLAKLFAFFVFFPLSFPGGLADIGDGSPEGTALRELGEELGVESPDVEVWGRTVDLPDKHMTSLVSPVIGHIRNFSAESLRMNCAEVGVAPSGGEGGKGKGRGGKRGSRSRKSRVA